MNHTNPLVTTKHNFVLDRKILFIDSNDRDKERWPNASEFEITYMYIDKKNNYIPKIARCVLTDMTIDQSPEGVFTTFKSDEKGAFPTATKVTLAFTETEIMTKQKVAGGF
jgi:hypothetical protein